MVEESSSSSVWRTAVVVREALVEQPMRRVEERPEHRLDHPIEQRLQLLEHRGHRPRRRKGVERRRQYPEALGADHRACKEDLPRLGGEIRAFPGA